LKSDDLVNNEFISAYTPDSKFTIIDKQEGEYKFRVVGSKGAGIGIFLPVDFTCARFVREANSEERESYWSAWPQLDCILVCLTDLGWCAFPTDLPIAKSALKVEQEIIVRQVSNGKRFDFITVRCDGVRFWYESSCAEEEKSSCIQECYDGRSNIQFMKRKLEKVKALSPEEKKSLDLAVASENRDIRGCDIELSWQVQSGAINGPLIDGKTFDVMCAGMFVNS